MYVSSKVQARIAFAVEKQYILHICVCARARTLIIQHAICMRHIVTSFVAPLVPPYSSTLSHKRRDFRKKKVIENKMCFDFLYVCLEHFSF